MTTKPKHTTRRNRHSASTRVDKQKQLEREFDRELRRQLNELEPVAPIPTVGKAERFGPVVVYTVRTQDGGLPFRYEYKSKPGTWRTVAEADAVKHMRQQGLVLHAHIETREEA